MACNTSYKDISACKEGYTQYNDLDTSNKEIGKSYNKEHA